MSAVLRGVQRGFPGGAQEGAEKQARLTSTAQGKPATA